MISLKIAILGFFTQLMLLLSIFDIYFQSPIINDIPDQQVNFEASADRLVLISADGLRSDKFYEYTNEYNTYFK